MTKLLKDILGQPAAFREALRHHRENGFAEFDRAASTLRFANEIIIVAIGASYNAGLAVAHALQSQGRMASVVDASEFDAIATLPPCAVVLFLSRSGKSIELIRGAERTRRQKIPIVAITNDARSPVGTSADCHIALHVPFDHAVSIATYTAIILVAVLLVHHVADASHTRQIAGELEHAAAGIGQILPTWQQRLGSVGSDFNQRFTYFLARRESLASAHAGMLLWQEVIKTPAVALTTGTFRHGPQEVLRVPMNIFLWLSPGPSFDHDVQLASDIAKTGSTVIVLSRQQVDVPGAVSWVTPSVRPEFSAAFDIIPVQLWAERLAGLAGVDCDRFIYCNYIVEQDGGL